MLYFGSLKTKIKAKMRNFDEKRNTTNSCVFKRAAVFPILGCPVCAPNKGCNRFKGSISHSWKDQTKKRKQWM